MALSDTQTVSLYGVLEMPMFDTINKLIDPDNLTVEPRIAASTTRNAILQLEAHLADLASNYSGLETELKVYLDSWDALGTQTYTLDGGTGGIDGVAYNPEQERIEIRRKVLVIVPFYRAHEEMSRLDELKTDVLICR